MAETGNVSSKSKTDLHDTGSYQVDIAMSFFAVLLIVLLTASTKDMLGKGNDPTDYAHTDTETSRFAMRSSCILYPFKQVWLVRSGHVFELDLREVSMTYLASDPAAGSLLYHDEGGFTIELEQVAQHADTSFLLLLEWRNFDALPMRFVRQEFRFPGSSEGPPARDAAELLAQFASPVLLYIWPDMRETAFAIINRLKDPGRIVEVDWVTRDRVHYNRIPENFNADTLFRC